jgi:hypothetical protein
MMTLFQNAAAPQLSRRNDTRNCNVLGPRINVIRTVHWHALKGLGTSTHVAS